MCTGVATAFAELKEGRDLKFDAGTLEIDATKTAIDRKSSKTKNTHRGRFLIVYHRESGQYALEPLDNKTVLKGAPPPPEAYEEVRAVVQKKVDANRHVVSSDSSQAIKKSVKAKGLCMPL